MGKVRSQKAEIICTAADAVLSSVWPTPVRESSTQVIKQRLVLVAVLSLLLIPINSALALEPHISVPGLDNFQSVSDRLSRGANPSEEGLIQLQKSGIKTIINLRHSSRHESNEMETAKRLGLKYIHLPMGFAVPSSRVIQQFLSLVSDPQYQPVYVHCRQGADRTGTLVAIYRIVVQNWRFQEAYKEMRLHHFKPWMAALKRTVFRYSIQPITVQNCAQYTVVKSLPSESSDAKTVVHSTVSTESSNTAKLLVTGGMERADLVNLGM